MGDIARKAKITLCLLLASSTIGQSLWYLCESQSEFGDIAKITEELFFLLVFFFLGGGGDYHVDETMQTSMRKTFITMMCCVTHYVWIVVAQM